ncbi:MAG: hypothetical protein ACYCZ2_15040 [Lutibacter sp.]
MWDNFGTPREIEFFDFNFQAKRFEVWENQEKIDFGNTDNFLSFEKKLELKNEIGILRNTDTSLQKYISKKLEFDKIFTAVDRVLLLLLPEIGGNKNCLSFIAQTYCHDYTRYIKDFEENEPFACCLFFQDSEIKKITFDFCNPDRLLELYAY